MHVHQDQVEIAALELRQRLLPVIGKLDRIPALAEYGAHHFLVHLIVFHHEDASRNRLRGCRAAQRLLSVLNGASGRHTAR